MSFLDVKKDFKHRLGLNDEIRVIVGDFLFEGGNGIVYKGEIFDVKSGNKIEDVAVKFTNDDKEVDNIEIAESDKLFTKCNGILQYIDIIKGSYFNVRNEKNILRTKKYMIVYKYMNEKDLGKYIEKLGYITYDNYLEILIKIYNVYNCLISYGFTYEDLKPGNILINLDSKQNISNVFLGDLGGLLEMDDDVRDIDEYGSTYRSPFTRCTATTLMTWEFIIFSLLIHPNLSDIVKKRISDIFAHNSKINFKTENNLFKIITDQKEQKELTDNIPEEILNVINRVIENFEYKNEDDIYIETTEKKRIPLSETMFALNAIGKKYAVFKRTITPTMTERKTTFKYKKNYKSTSKKYRKKSSKKYRKKSSKKYRKKSSKKYRKKSSKKYRNTYIYKK